MKKIIYSSGFTTYQKFFLILLFLPASFFGPFLFLGLIAWNLDYPNHQQEALSPIIYVINLFALSITFFILFLLLRKKGVFVENNKLYTAKFLLGRLIRKKEVSLDQITDISILTFNGTQKFAWSSIARPDQGYQVKRYELYLLNSRHTVKNYLIDTQKEDLAKKGVAMIVKHFNLNHALYDPRF